MPINDIMREERERMLAELAKLPLPQEARDDVLRACAALRLLADEHERVSRRFVSSGIAGSLQ